MKTLKMLVPLSESLEVLSANNVLKVTSLLWILKVNVPFIQLNVPFISMKFFL